MARLPRVVAVDVAHHVTQRGKARQAIFVSDQDRVAYLELLRQYADLYHLSLLGYCLMSNHVHLIVVPRNPTALSETLKHTHGTLRILLERPPVVQRACVAGTLLLLSAGRFASVGGSALCGVESSACRHSVSARGVAMVERRGTLQSPRRSGHSGRGALAKALDGRRLDRVSGSPRIAKRC
jgi:REP element-mobilizing transposase RayT